MLKKILSFGLRRNLYVSFPVALIAVLAALSWSVNRQVREALELGLTGRGQSMVRALAGRLQLPLLRDKEDLALKELGDLFEEKDVAYAIVQRADHTVLASRFGEGFSRESDFARVLAEHDRHQNQAAFKSDRFFGFAMPVKDVELDSQSGEDLLLNGGLSGGAAGGKQVTRGYVLLGLSTEPLKAQAGRVQLVILLYVALGSAIFLLLVYLITGQFVLRPINQMKEVAQRISECDLTARAEKIADDELGTMSDAMNRISENLNATLSSVKGVTEGVGVVIERISRTGDTVSHGAGTVAARVEETSSSMLEMTASLKGIAENVEVLAQSAEESSSSILEMAATNDEVAENIQSLAASVEETTAAIEQMTFSIKEVAKNIEDLSATAEETSSSMNEMDVSISQVETNANETAKLSEQATKDAEIGAEALSRTLTGIDKIKDSSKEAAEVIEALGRKIATVGNILNVIDDVAEQTNLLALNAAILAAQSGEHGKGFAVVADEIKDLAERTGASTKEISELIRSVQDESKNAVVAMDRGVKNVEEGVRLGQEAEGALKKIQDSSQKATQMVKAIARATIEQARGSKQVTMAINRIAETVQQIASATAEQARGSEQIMKSAEKMKIITKHVERSSQEQARGSKQITKSIESISEMVNHLNRAQKEQTKGAEQVMSAVDQIKGVADAQSRSVSELESAIDDLTRQAETLRGEVRRFKL